jgi:hypothetical protein
MRRRLAALLVLVLAAAGSLRADVAPFPSWRLAANGTITRAVHAGSAIYLAGGFTKIGRAVPAFGATLDPATLSLTPRTGCAHTGTGVMAGHYLAFPGGLSDGAGPFPVPPGTALVRLGADCRFDRRFRVVFPPGVSMLPSFDPFVAESRGRVYKHLTVNSAATYLVEFDGVSGAVRRYWLSSSAPVVRGLPDGRLVGRRSDGSGTTTEIGVFDPDTGLFTVTYSTSGSWTVVHAGAVVLLGRGTNGELLALDATTLTPLMNWPAVRVDGGAAYGSGDGRLFVAAGQVSIAGVAAPHLVAFDAATGAHSPGFSVPSWVDDASTRVNHLSVANGRVLAFGDFVPGAPRDTAAAFDAVTGALDPWVLPYAVPTPTTIGVVLYFPQIEARDRVARTAVAAVDAATGAVLPWTATVPLIPSPTFGSYALAADAAAGHLYVGWTGAVRRFDLTTGQLDSTWTLDAEDPTAGFKEISDIAVAGASIYVSGSFSRVRDGAASAWQPYEGAAAITKTGVLTTWQPQVRGNCFIPVRPTGLNFPCVSQLLSVAGRLVMQGRITRLHAPGEAVRSAMAVTSDTGAADGFLPVVPLGVVSAIATDGPALLATVRLPALSLVRVDEISGARIVGPLGADANGFDPRLAVHAGRLYADVERDVATGAVSANRTRWSRPIDAVSGVLDVAGNRVSHHADVAAVVPQPPTNLTARLEASLVTLQWSLGTGDHAPLVAPPPPGGTAATSHIVLASLTPGGAPIAQIDTGSAETTFSIAAPLGTFYVRVQATNGFGTSLPSAEVRVDVAPQPPSPPLATMATVSGRTVHIEWQAPPLGWPATGYVLEAGTGPGLTDIGTLPVGGLSFDAPVPPGRYYVRIRAVNAQGASIPGDEVVLDVP